MHVRKKDKVVLLSGKDKGKRGEIIEVNPELGKVLVAKLNYVKKHARPSKAAPGGIRDQENYLPISKVMLVCPKCGQPTRPKSDTLSDGKRVRACRRCGEMIG